MVITEESKYWGDG